MRILRVIKSDLTTKPTDEKDIETARNDLIHDLTPFLSEPESQNALALRVSKMFTKVNQLNRLRSCHQDEWHLTWSEKKEKKSLVVFPALYKGNVQKLHAIKHEHPLSGRHDDEDDHVHHSPTKPPSLAEVSGEKSKRKSLVDC